MWLDHDMISIGVKMVFAAVVVVASSFIAERSGPFWGAVVATLPVLAGPVYVMLALEADAPFVARSALGSVAASPAIALFMAVAAWTAPRLNVFLCLAAAFLTWLAAVLVIVTIEWDAVRAVGANLCAFAICLWATGRAWRRRIELVRPPRRWYDLPLRAAAVATLVVTILSVSKAIGPAATGIAAVFPISLSMFACIVHVRLGGQAAAVAMASASRTFLGLLAGLLVIHLAAASWGVWQALTAALAVNLLCSAGVIAWRQNLGGPIAVINPPRLRRDGR